MTDSIRIAVTGSAYFMRREAQERALLEKATDPGARIAHAELAKRYAALNRTPEQA
ncbi:hypothetical protein ACFOKI_06535 [Sphingomonas qilianensis]|uniref:Uncharacterized protein n=1 Tax=Sphingomonas qilianensis TaxID=1736690 RepID=A0ABU9XR36_9SPHN